MDLMQYLTVASELSQLCTQNGWIDNDTLHVDILERQPHALLAAVTFEEIVMEGAGCIAARQPCYGCVRAHLNDAGEVTTITVV
jgi:hypothetical protein